MRSEDRDGERDQQYGRDEARCSVEPDKTDPLEEYGTLPKVPVAIWGWGWIPDQYGRRSEEGDENDYE